MGGGSMAESALAASSMGSTLGSTADPLAVGSGGVCGVGFGGGIPGASAAGGDGEGVVFPAVNINRHAAASPVYHDGKRVCCTPPSADARPASTKGYANLSAFHSHGQRAMPFVCSAPVQHNLPLTDLRCWWCCHGFNWHPFVMPTHKDGANYQSIGCFCSPECTAAYIFESGSRHGDPWVQYSLLHELIARQVNGRLVNIKLSPPRETLNIFGGPYSIEEFRNILTNYHLDVKVTMPPINPINGVTEETPVEYAVKQNGFVPLDEKRLKKATHKLRLKRQRNASTGENTLEAFMQLKIGGNGGATLPQE